MLKLSLSLPNPDTRSAGMAMDALHGMVHRVELNNDVPSSIREQFDVARNAFAYSWFVYEFTMLAEQQCYFTLELALKQRLFPGVTPSTAKRRGLGNLMNAAVRNGLLNREELMISPIGEDATPMCQLDLIVQSRNHLMHGNINLLPQYALLMIEMVASILNALYRNRPR